MSLFDTYNAMQQKEAEAQIVEQRIAVLDAYTKLAAEKLEENYPGNWTQEDQAKLAAALIELDQEAAEAEEKVATIKEAAAIFARETWNEWTRLDNETR